ncbi:MAG: iron chelate uptake ABC transporter family permease subunit, partial [Pirellulales bacterium]
MRPCPASRWRFCCNRSLDFPGKHLPGLLLGALVAGLAGMACIQGIRKIGRIQEDAAMGIVLSVFYGFGVCLLGVIQSMHEGSSAGLKSFIYGKTASMLSSDAILIAVAACGIAVLAGLLFKEFTLLCFDEDYAGSQGWPTGRLDALLMGAVVCVTVIGLQAVGLILMIALLVVPPAA